MAEACVRDAFDMADESESPDPRFPLPHPAPLGTLRVACDPPRASPSPLASALDTCELRNILTGFGANIAYLEAVFERGPRLRDDAPLPDVLEVLQDLRESYRRMLGLAQEAAVMSRPTERPMVQVEVPLSRLVADAVRAVDDAAMLAGVKVAVDPPPAVLVEADVTLMACVLERMLHNAIRWAQPSGVANLAFLVSSQKVTCAAFATYPDNPEATVRESCERELCFESMPPAPEAIEGALGVEFCRVVAESHGGVFSIRGGGRLARWVLTLPIVAPAP
jgi:light-regulated signal transduction histidine kinase (bacteriophytochrome)